MQLNESTTQAVHFQSESKKYKERYKKLCELLKDVEGIDGFLFILFHSIFFFIHHSNRSLTAVFAVSWYFIFYPNMCVNSRRIDFFKLLAYLNIC